ncbi:MAG: hypothetical protein ACQKBV_10120 [Puniceicoccales bacterium]
MHRKISWLVAVALIGVQLLIHADTGVAVVDSVVGDVTFSSTSGDIVRGEAIDPNGLKIQTGMNGYVSLVFSNGLALLAPPNTELEITNYSQEPFTSRSDDLVFEPSRSKLNLSLPRGQLAFAGRELSPSSELSVEFRPGHSVDLHSKAAYIENQVGETTIAPIHGRCTIEYDSQRHLVREGYRFQTSPGESISSDRLRKQNPSEKEDWTQQIDAARLSLNRWRFDSQGDDTAAEAVRVVPALKIQETPFNNTKI